MQPSPVLFLLMMTLLNTCSCSSIPQKEQELNTNSLHQQDVQDLQQQIKNYTLQEDAVREGNNTGSSHQNDLSAGRTFGLKLRPLKLAIPAIMYKLGVVTTMLGVLTLLSAKSLLVGIVILIIQLSSGFAKLALLKKEHHAEEESPHKPPQNIHVHVHGGGASGGYHKPVYSHSPYSPWSKTDLASGNSRIDDDYYQRLKELKELKDLRESLYTQVI